MKQRRFRWALLSTLALAVGACWWLPLAGTGAKTRPPGQAQGGAGELTAYRGDLTERLLLTGELEAEDAERLVVPNANIWPVQIRWLAEDGIEVEEGDRVAELDNSQLAANLEDLRGQAIEAANRLKSLKAQAATEEAVAGFELERKRAAVEKARLLAEVPPGVLAERTYRQRQLDLQKAELALEEAVANLESTRRSKRAEIEVQRLALEKIAAQVARSESRIELLTLTASRDGILILDHHHREGRPLQVGDGVYPGWSIGRLPDLSTMIVSARLFDVDDGRVAPGMRVVATLDAFPEIAFPGRLREIDPIADQASSRSLRRFFRARIDLDRVDTERMRPGMSVKVLIEVPHDDVLLAPRQSLDWSESGARALLADGTWKAVTLGPCDREACVVAEGLEASTPLERIGPAAREGAGEAG